MLGDAGFAADPMRKVGHLMRVGCHYTILHEEGRCDWVIKRSELRNEQALPESSSVGLFGMMKIETDECGPHWQHRAAGEGEQSGWFHTCILCMMPSFR